jgi:hypothetical protein
LKNEYYEEPILTLGASGARDAKNAASPLVIKEKGVWYYK